jgi:HD superfamily phosphodiesterase
VLHSLRVESYALQILAREPHPLSETEVKLVRLAAILHDIARLGDRRTHAQTGAEIAGKWLRSHADMLGADDIIRIERMIANHPNKDLPDDDFCSAVLKDADVLDEIGVMSIFMASNWLEKESAFFFHELRRRIIERELPFCDHEMTRLQTNAAREILKEKKTFIENFVAQITDEIMLDGEIETMLK